MSKLMHAEILYLIEDQNRLKVVVYNQQYGIKTIIICYLQVIAKRFLTAF